jgi:hypothetical protein
MLFYAGPDQIIPLASALSTIIGVVLIFWGKLVQAFRKVVSVLAPRPGSPEKPGV